MATTLNISRFIRSIRQGRTTAPVACTAMASCTKQAYDALVAASWTRVEEKEAGLPRHNWAQTGFSNRWDAAHFCGDYADGYQHGYATAVVYTVKMPADALAGTAAKIASVALPVRGDRWLADGCNIGITLSTSATPPEWAATPTDSVAGQLAVVPSNEGSDTAATVVFDWSAAPKTVTAYLHIVLRLTDYLTHRGAWIEGGAMLDGAAIAVTFNRDVTPDSSSGYDDEVAAMHFFVPQIEYDGVSVPQTRLFAGYTYSGGQMGYGSDAATMQESLNAVQQFRGYSVDLTPSAWVQNLPALYQHGAYVMRHSGSTSRAYATSYAYGLTAPGKTFQTVVLKYFAGMAASAGVDVCVVLYACDVSSSFSAYRWTGFVGYQNNIVPYGLWAGTAQSLSIVTTVDVAWRTESAACILNTVISGGTTLPAGHAFRLTTPFTPVGPTLLRLCLSVANITSAPGATVDVPYGLLFEPDFAIWFRDC